MSDQVVEVGKIVEISPEERFKHALHSVLTTWVETDFRMGLKKLTEQKHKGNNSIQNSKSFAELSNDLTAALHVLREDGVAQEYDSQLTETLFGQGKDSVVNCCGEKNRQEIEEALIGPISILTLIEAFKKTDNKNVDNIDITKIVAPSEVDVKNKVDLILDFGTKTKGGKPVVRLIQLKTTREPRFYVEKDIPGSARSPYTREKVSSSDIKKMREHANQLKKEGIHPIIYTVIVPAFDSVLINNVFGVPQPALLGKDKFNRTMEKFCEDVKRTGLLPKG